MSQCTRLMYRLETGASYLFTDASAPADYKVTVNRLTGQVAINAIFADANGKSATYAASGQCHQVTLTPKL